MKFFLIVRYFRAETITLRLIRRHPAKRKRKEKGHTSMMAIKNAKIQQ